MYCLTVYVKEGLLSARELFLENSAVSYFFFLYQSLSLSFCRVFYSTLSNIDEVLSINPSANVFVFGNFNVHNKDWLTYSGGTDLVNPVTISLSQITLIRWLTFLLRFQTVILIVLLFWIYFFLLMLVFVL